MGARKKLFTHENKIQTRVSAELKKNKMLVPSNVLQITWELPDRVPEVVPQFYNEYMAYLTGLLILHMATVLSGFTLLKERVSRVNFMNSEILCI